MRVAARVVVGVVGAIFTENAAVMKSTLFAIMNGTLFWPRPWPLQLDVQMLSVNRASLGASCWSQQVHVVEVHPVVDFVVVLGIALGPWSERRAITSSVSLA